jgi:hypothetical protein
MGFLPSYDMEYQQVKDIDGVVGLIPLRGRGIQTRKDTLGIEPCRPTLAALHTLAGLMWIFSQDLIPVESISYAVK